MQRTWGKAWLSRELAYGVAAFVLFALLIAYRRPAEFAHPMIWDEDGSWNLADYVHYGFASLFRPVQGYLNLAPKLFTIVSVKLSFVHYPLIANVLATLFEALVLIAIWRCPTVLRGRFFCALAVVLIPTDAEVFVLPLYTFWFVGLLTVLALLWQPGKASGWLTAVRWLFVALGGLSSPLIVALAPLFVIRAVLISRRDRVLAAFAVALAVLQLVVLHSTHTLAGITPVSKLLEPTELTAFWENYVGGLVAYTDPQTTWPMFVAEAVIVAVATANAGRIKAPILVLLVLYAMAVARSVARVPPSLTAPYITGPRYFFYPFIFLAWAMIGLAAVAGPVGRVALALLLCSTAVGSLMRFQRDSAPLNWVAGVVACSHASGDSYALPVQFDGSFERAWSVSLKPSDCMRLRRESLYPDRKAWLGQ